MHKDLTQERPRSYTTVLTIAGSDTCAGAGIQADLKTFSALHCYGLTVITALTAQNTRGVDAVIPVDKEFTRKQLHALLEDINIDAVKTGMLGNSGTIQVVAEELRKLKGIPVIVDTVLASTGGSCLLDSDAVPLMKELLFPQATLVTPNIPEAATLTGKKRLPTSRTQIRKTAEELLASGPEAVMIKGGHMEGDECSDLLLTRQKEVWLTSKRIDTPNTHGTGCTLSSAVAAFMARGMQLENAVRQAKHYVHESLQAGARFTMGKGHGPLHHAYRYWNASEMSIREDSGAAGRSSNR
ncbi:MAG: bifunctional hydroxymethylpyrimidine kinase/phosphomethylpyrimidine kinase [Prosthecochloris sp.]|nr:bifunctional hydroxymethylpyrimidine kinase/phosphomethylpyrimidine kinase [Prosthecochloris sp.]